MKQKFPGKKMVNLVEKAECQGTTYSIGMMLVYDSTDELPDFAEILQTVVVCDSLIFVVKLHTSWYCEHLRSFKLESTSTLKVLQHSQLKDVYPLVTYSVGGDRMVSLKHHISFDSKVKPNFVLPEHLLYYLNIYTLLFFYPSAYPALKRCLVLLLSCASSSRRPKFTKCTFQMESQPQWKNCFRQ